MEDVPARLSDVELLSFVAELLGHLPGRHADALLRGLSPPVGVQVERQF